MTRMLVRGDRESLPMSRVWLAPAITVVVLGGLGVQWWRDYRRHRHADARSWVQRLRAWRLRGLGLLVIGLLLELVSFGTSLGGRILLVIGTVGFGGCTVVVTWLALAAHRRYPGLVLDIDASGADVNMAGTAGSHPSAARSADAAEERGRRGAPPETEPPMGDNRP
jgi:hypothetical protein